MKFKKDVLATLATVAAVLVALFAIFVTIPVWLVSVVATLAVVGACVTVNEIVKAYKASYDEETGKHTYKFPLREVAFGTAILVAVAAIILLSLKRLFGFALIPVAILLAILLVIAILKKLRVMQIVVGLILVVLVVALIGYFTSVLVHNGTDLNPGVSVETTTPETDTPTTDVPAIEETEEESEETVPNEEETEEESEETIPEEDVTEEESEETTPEEDTTEEESEETTPEEDVTEEESEETIPEEEELEEEVIYAEIYAPETLTYGETIVLYTNCIEPDNLKFSDEEFLLIQVYASNEIGVTLVGCVGENGELVYVPAAGYITVTDSVSGVSVIIETIAPEIQEPEIEVEDDVVVEDNPVEDVVKPEDETEETIPEEEEPEVEIEETIPEEEVTEEETEETIPEEEEPEVEPEETIPEEDVEDEYVPVIIKIDAPETMSYAEPITIKLEGISAYDLKFGNEDFLYIDIISDSEVEITLIGIVNDAGEVEFVPASGYITITDSVSGVHVIIDIVE